MVGGRTTAELQCWHPCKQASCSADHPLYATLCCAPLQHPSTGPVKCITRQKAAIAIVALHSGCDIRRTLDDAWSRHAARPPHRVAADADAARHWAAAADARGSRGGAAAPCCSAQHLSQLLQNTIHSLLADEALQKERKGGRGTSVEGNSGSSKCRRGSAGSGRGGQHH